MKHNNQNDYNINHFAVSVDQNNCVNNSLILVLDCSQSETNKLLEDSSEPSSEVKKSQSLEVIKELTDGAQNLIGQAFDLVVDCFANNTNNCSNSETKTK